MNTKDQIVSIANRMILEKGYNSFSYQHLSAEIGIKKASIHYHFPAKHDLGIAVIQFHHESFKNFVTEIKEKGKSPMQQLDEFFGTYKHIITQKNQICLAGILGAEFKTLPENMQEEMQSYFESRRKWLEKVLADGLYSGDFRFTGQPKDMVFIIMSTLQGILQIARTNQNPDYFFLATQKIKNLLLNG
ncbi:MAG: TetR/AcrR family transcriptional regulator [Cyclobacteriaceae bacterium]|nr:TetR/AcrR family transcriptional regulator [Cyclobacteriaceae bacterium]MCH8514981.1 TetR/AcrR family transcriptional regulator [Cyclobacteriaceae bacterium]